MSFINRQRVVQTGHKTETEGSHGFNIITGAATAAAEPGPAAASPISSPTKPGDPSFSEFEFFNYMNNRDSAGAALSQTDIKGKPSQPPGQPEAPAVFNQGRKAYLAATYSQAWNPQHPGAGEAAPTTASAYVAHSAPHATPNLNYQSTMASTMVLEHPAATAKEYAYLPEAPQHATPSIQTANSLQAAGSRIHIGTPY